MIMGKSYSVAFNAEFNKPDRMISLKVSWDEEARCRCRGGQMHLPEMQRSPHLRP